MVPVKAWLPERLLMKRAYIGWLRPNPDDEFSMPEIGPNYEIISKYMGLYQQYGSMKDPNSIEGAPLIVQKVYPGGYMILNGHHRWAAYWRSGAKIIPISIANLTQETDIAKIIKRSKHDKRVTMDLDEVIFCQPGDRAEKPRKGLAKRFFKERLRRGIPALLHYLSRHGYDI